MLYVTYYICYMLYMLYVIYVIYYICYVLYNFNTFTSRSNFTLVYNEGIKEKAPPMNFSDYKIGFAIGLSIGDNTNKEILEKLYEYFELNFHSYEI